MCEWFDERVKHKKKKNQIHVYWFALVCVCRSMCTKRDCVLHTFHVRSNRSDDRSHTYNEKRPCSTTMDAHCLQLFPLTPVIRLWQFSWTGYEARKTRTANAHKNEVHLNLSGVCLPRFIFFSWVFDKYKYVDFVFLKIEVQRDCPRLRERSNRHYLCVCIWINFGRTWH